MYLTTTHLASAHTTFRMQTYQRKPRPKISALTPSAKDNMKTILCDACRSTGLGSCEHCNSARCEFVCGVCDGTGRHNGLECDNCLGAGYYQQGLSMLHSTFTAVPCKWCRKSICATCLGSGVLKDDGSPLDRVLTKKRKTK